MIWNTGKVTEKDMRDVLFSGKTYDDIARHTGMERQQIVDLVKAYVVLSEAAGRAPDE